MADSSFYFQSVIPSATVMAVQHAVLLESGGRKATPDKADFPKTERQFSPAQKVEGERVFLPFVAKQPIRLCVKAWPYDRREMN